MDLVDMAAIAARLGTTPGTVKSWRHRPVGFPKPRAVLAIGSVWDWGEVATWAQRTGRLHSPIKTRPAAPNEKT
jgi:hypothetical protein